MNEVDRESAIKSSAKKALDQTVESLDSETLSRIGSARRKALSELGKSKRGFSPWLGVGAGGLAMAGFALFVVLRMSPPMDLEIIQAGEDIELLASSEDLEFYDQMEFYQWLVEENLVPENHS